MGNTQPKKNKEDDSGLSKNNGKSVRYRVRKQQEQEADQEIYEFKKQESKKSK
jgi:hypothetical protein